ncbi:MAG: 4-hydroxy-tetrahydrodipicolinate synthase [Candidatus Eisenbacteria bacterium]|nr:4-hydroxy-tetrahydrodipicolinate synthase [Candidatus Eisenbacteria bacterium]
MFEGVFVASVTPFRKGQVDEEAFASHVERLIEGGVQGIVPAGCTGEAATLTLDEKKRLFKLTKEISGGRVSVVGGSGTNATSTSIELTRLVKECGLDGAMLITPYYNKPTQEGLFRHYEAVAEAVNIPLVIYNVPGRTGVNILPDTVARLSEIKSIVAIKEASGLLDQVSAILSKCSITVLSGDDSLTLPMLSIGAKGVVSVTANVVPEDVVEMVESFLSGKEALSREKHMKLFPLSKAMFVETNPSPVKKALELLGLIEGDLRLPLVPVGKESERVIREALTRHGLKPREPLGAR